MGLQNIHSVILHLLYDQVTWKLVGYCWCFPDGEMEGTFPTCPTISFVQGLTIGERKDSFKAPWATV